MTDRLRLLVTEHCTLCGDALEWLLQRQELQGWLLESFDLITAPALIDSHGSRVPVLQRLGADAQLRGEIDWPFTEASLRSLLSCADGDH
ncbi:MAG: glutaredoxin family protein [Pseudomonadota bacterium]